MRCGPRLLKIASGLLLCGLISSSLYVFACLSGSSAGFLDVFGMIAGLLALHDAAAGQFLSGGLGFLAIDSVGGRLGTLHLAFWIVAHLFRRSRFIPGNGAPRGLGRRSLLFWISLFVVVSLQMTTALRPLVGTAPTLLPVE